MYQCATNIYSRRIINVFVQYAPLKWLPVNSNNKQWGGFSDFNNVVLEIFWDIRDEFQYVNNQGVERSTQFVIICLCLSICNSLLYLI